MPTRGAQQKPVPFCSLCFGACDALGTSNCNGVNDVTSNGHLGSGKSLVAHPLARNIYVPCLVGMCVVGIYVVLSLGISKLINNRCADYRLQDHGLHCVQIRWHKEDYGLRGGGGGRGGDWY